MSDQLEKLIHLLDEAFTMLYREELGLNRAESIFVEILEIVRSDDQARSWFVQKTVEEISSGGQVLVRPEKRPSGFIDSDLICFITHATRWPEFSVAAENRKLSDDYIKKLPGNKDIADLIIESFSDDWGDKDFYQKFVK